ncbi:MAG: amino acid permease [Pseudomonadota bacterium]
MSAYKVPAARIDALSATAMVISNMIGTGVFTSLGFQLAGIKHTFSILMLWVIGAVMALCGAMAYGELGAAMPRSGGEYNYLSKIYHPAIGFLSGWVSLTIGFAAPAALSSMAFGAYLARVFQFISPMAAGITMLTLLTLLHCTGIKAGTAFQKSATFFNMLLILVFVVCGLFFTHNTLPVPLIPDASSLKDLLTPAFAVSLVYVTYAYSGWNAAAYVAGDMAQPKKILPLSLCAGTGIVAVLYLLLNYTFLKTASVDALAGQVDVAYVSAGNVFGPGGGSLVSCIISLLLISSVSSFVFVGPRIMQTMGEDIHEIRFFSGKTKNGAPARAIIFQYVISIFLVLTGSFEKVLLYVGFTINLCAFMTVLGLFIHRHKYKHSERPYKVWGYPFTPVLFLLIMLWNLTYLLLEKPVQSFAGLATVLFGLVFYYCGRASANQENHKAQL